MPTQLTRFVAFSVAGLAALTLYTPEAHADRRSSLAGNMLIRDADDVYLYPQLTLEHRNLISFDYFPGIALDSVLSSGAQNVSGTGSGGSSNGDFNADFNNSANFTTTNNSTVGAPNGLGQRGEEAASVPNGPAAMGGSGLLLFGQEGFAFGIASHREEWYGASPNAFLGVGDLQLYGNSRQQAWSFLGYNGPVPGGQAIPAATPTGNGAPSTAGQGGGTFLQPLQLVDLMMGFGLGETSSFGLRLSAGQSTFREERLGAGVEDFETWNTTVIDIVAGFSLRGDFDLDLGAEFGLAFFSNRYETNETEPNYLDSATLAPSFSLTARGESELQESVSLGFLGILHVNTASFNDEFGATGQTAADNGQFSSTNVFLEGGAGPVYKLLDNTLISAYGTVGFGSSSYKDENASFSTTGLLLPGFKAALETWLYKWLAFRTGMSSRYYFTFASRSFDSDATPNVSATSTFYEFLWSVGLGVALGNFELNGTFQTPFVTNGPFFIGGQPSGMFALLNAQYKF